ncbi:MAG: hypothetical protein IPM71_08875 [Bacteroidota bacterium]|nr:MAG: hypothetical protein IPM71_08875 [Bacteroidota bacterium]
MKRIKTGALVLEGHVQGLSNTRALGEAGIPVYVVDTNNCLARYSRHCKKFFLCPDFRSPDFIQFLVDLAQKENLAGWVLIPSNDHIVENLSNNLSIIQTYYKTVVPAPDQLTDIIDKGRLIEIARSCKVPVPETIFYSNVDQAGSRLRYPVLVKGRAGLSFYKNLRAKAIQAESLAELKAILPDIASRVPPENILIQELIPSHPAHKVISFTAFCIGGEIKAHWSGIKIREHPVKYGTGTFAKSVYNEQCHRQSIVLLKQLGYTGVCEVEYLFDERDQQYKLIEINPRTWLWVGLAKACGVNHTLMVYNYLQGIAMDYPKSYTLNLGWMNYFTDTVFALKALMKRQLRLKDYLRSMWMRKKNAVFSWSDPLPGLVFPFMVFYIAHKRG